MRFPNEAKAEGYTIDTSVYPNIAYKSSEDRFPVYTETEEIVIKSLQMLELRVRGLIYEPIKEYATNLHELIDEHATAKAVLGCLVLNTEKNNG